MTDRRTEQPEELGHEPITISVRAVTVALAILFAAVVAALLLMGGLAMYFAHLWQAAPEVGPVEPRIALPPDVPALVADQPAMLRRLREREEQLLTEYRWVDREEGVARIPVHRAMEITAREATANTEPPDDDDL